MRKKSDLDPIFQRDFMFCGSLEQGHCKDMSCKLWVKGFIWTNKNTNKKLKRTQYLEIS